MMNKFYFFIFLFILLFSVLGESPAQQQSPKKKAPLTQSQKKRLMETHEEKMEREFERHKNPFVKLPAFSKSPKSSSVTISDINLSNEGSPQNEPTISISHKDPNKMMAAWRDFRTGVSPAVRRIGYTYSTDGGSNWSEVNLLQDLTGLPRHSDPAMCVDTAGLFYLATVSLDNFNNNLKLVVYKSDKDLEGSFTGAYFVPSDTAPNFYDKEYIACDLTPSSPFVNNLYLVWSGTSFSRSTDAGVTWSSALDLTPGDFGFAPDLSVSKDGSVNISTTIGNYVSYLRSTDGGVNFSESVNVDTIISDGYFGCGSVFLYYNITSIASDISSGPFQNNTYIVWSDERYGDFDIFLKRTTDGGATWSKAYRVNDDSIGNGKNQIKPWITVDDKGVVSVVFYDTRNTSGCYITETYLASSVDGGKTFKNLLLSSAMTAHNQPNGDVRIGEYIGIDSWGGKTASVWTDERAGGYDMDIYASITPVTDSIVKGSISGYVFNDANGNKYNDGGDSPLPGWHVLLTQNDDSVNVITDSVGKYSFTGLHSGDYTLTLAREEGWIPTTPSDPGPYAIHLDSNQIMTDTDFGNIFLSDSSSIIQTSEGWNLVSLPRSTTNNSASLLFPQATSSPFNFRQGYFKTDTLEPGKGYWLKFNESIFNIISGDSLSQDSVPVYQGWNLVGSLTNPVPVNNISSTPESLISSSYFRFSDGVYSTADTLEPGAGYWAKAKQDGMLYLTTNPIVAKRNSQQNLLATNINSITVRDASHRKSVIYISNDDNNIPLSRFELPPKAPESKFDIRFASQRLLETYPREHSSQQEYPLEIQAVDYPLTLEWNITDATKTFSIGTKTFSHKEETKISGSGSLTVNNPVSGQMVLKVQSNEEELSLPSEFHLGESYPNPFNPTTEIRYQLPINSFVILKVYNILGQEVATLVNEFQQAGYKTATFEGGALPSGIYIYRMSAGDYSATKKTMLIK